MTIPIHKRNAVLQYAVRARKQHNSLIITLPKGFCEQLGICNRTYVIIELVEGANWGMIGKIQTGGMVDG